MIHQWGIMLTRAVTERARKLRVHYALQVQYLRARIERRVNRIPVVLRKVVMGELLDKHGAATRTGEGIYTFKKPAIPPRAIKNATTISVDVEIQGASATAAKTRIQHVKRRYEWLGHCAVLTAELL
jgi:hypothetical protein